jgi:hypothetical protein
MDGKSCKRAGIGPVVPVDPGDNWLWDWIGRLGEVAPVVSATLVLAGV